MNSIFITTKKWWLIQKFQCLWNNKIKWITRRRYESYALGKQKSKISSKNQLFYFSISYNHYCSRQCYYMADFSRKFLEFSGSLTALAYICRFFHGDRSKHSCQKFSHIPQIILPSVFLVHFSNISVTIVLLWVRGMCHRQGGNSL